MKLWQLPISGRLRRASDTSALNAASCDGLDSSVWMIWISWPKTSWNCYGGHVLASILPRRFIPIKRLTLSFTSPRLLFPSSICWTPSNALYQSRVTGCFRQSPLSFAVTKKGIFSYQTDRPGRTENLVIGSAIQTFVSLASKVFERHLFSISLIKSCQEHSNFTYLHLESVP